MIINKNNIKKINVDFVDKEMGFISYNDNVFKILSYFGSLFKNEIILDLGTNTGQSALALRNQNDDNLIISYDIMRNEIPYGRTKYRNIFFKILDINQEFPAILKNSKLMYLDVDPHDGIQERIFIDKLIEIGYTGLVLCDDIHLNSGMERFWNSVTQIKHDLSDIGHNHPSGEIYGTGLIDFTQKIEVI